jgi:hypothetical protein
MYVRLDRSVHDDVFGDTAAKADVARYNTPYSTTRTEATGTLDHICFSCGGHTTDQIAAD